MVGKIRKKWGIFNLRTGDWILKKFNILKDLVSQSSYVKFGPDLEILGELEEETGNPGKRLEWRGRDDNLWKNKHNSEIHDWHNQTGFNFFGELEGGC